MAAPLSIIIPTLVEKRTIEEYEPLVIAAVSAYTVTEEGKQAIIKMLPTYISAQLRGTGVPTGSFQKADTRRSFYASQGEPGYSPRRI